MRIGLFVSGVGVRPGFENLFSGHTQIAFKTAQLLKEANHEVHLLVTLQHEGLVIPGNLSKSFPIHILTDGRWRGRVGQDYRSSGGYKPLAIGKQVQEIRRTAANLELDILHLFGFERTAALSGLLRMAGLKCPTAVTVYARPQSKYWKWLARFGGRIIASTKYVQQGWDQAGISSVQIPHGIIRDLTNKLGSAVLPPEQRTRVLFWRGMVQLAGGDLCLDAFDRLAPEFPELSFDLALRPTVHEIPGAEELAKKHANVNLYRFPYQDGVTIEALVANSLCSVFPFRKLTIDPQLAIAETLAAGTACIASDVASIPEVITPGRNGEIFPSQNVHALTECLRKLLKNREQLWEYSHQAKNEFSSRWNWDNYVKQIVAVYQETSLRTNRAA